MKPNKYIYFKNEESQWDFCEALTGFSVLYIYFYCSNHKALQRGSFSCIHIHTSPSQTLQIEDNSLITFFLASSWDCFIDPEFNDIFSVTLSTFTIVVVLQIVYVYSTLYLVY